MLLEFAIVALILSYFLLVWLRTDAFAEYMLLFRITRFFRIEEYKQIRADGYDGNYIDFLNQYYNDSFFVRLLSCPICISFWLGLSCTFIWGLDGLLIAPLILFFYLLFNKLM
jgi:hypothetical protein